MITTKKKYIYLPQNLTTICQNYNNGYIIWMSGANSTAVQYLDATKNVPIKITMEGHKLVLTKSKLTTTQQFYNIYHKRYQTLISKYYNLINVQLNNAVLRATIGIKKYLLVRGVGYKFIKKNKYLTLQVGYSHKINIIIPNYIKTKLSRKSTKIKFTGDTVLFLTGLLAAIRRFKSPDVYKGKGIRYRRDNVIRKEGKKKKSF